MKILLINPTTINIIGTNLPKALQEKGDSVPPLGLMYLAGYLEKYTDYEVKILDCQIENIDYEQLGEKIKQENPDVVGITTTTFTLIDAIKTAGIVKKTNPKIKIVEQQAPLLVPIIESNALQYADSILKSYIKPLMNKKVDDILLGSTHYSILKAKIKKIVGEKIKIISQEEIIPRKLKNYLLRHPNP